MIGNIINNLEFTGHNLLFSCKSQQVRDCGLRPEVQLHEAGQGGAPPQGRQRPLSGKYNRIQIMGHELYGLTTYKVMAKN